MPLATVANSLWPRACGNLLNWGSEMPTSGERLRISLERQPAMHVTRVGLAHDKLVYVLVTRRPLKYQWGRRSRIAYIGMTQNGLSRVANSLAYRAKEILVGRGISECDVRIVTCRGRRRVRTWAKLERAMLLSFRETFGEVPKCNTQGKLMRETDEFQYFSRTAVKQVIEELSGE